MLTMLSTESYYFSCLILVAYALVPYFFLKKYESSHEMIPLKRGAFME